MIRINFTWEKDDWKKFGEKNVIIALNILYSKKEKIYPACVLKHNLKLEKQVILLMLPNGKGWHYLAAKKKKKKKKKKKIALWRGITFNTTLIFTVLIAFILLQQKTNVNLIKN